MDKSSAEQALKEQALRKQAEDQRIKALEEASKKRELEL